MLTDRLFREVLLAPAEEGANTLYVVSGYASAGMADRHFDSIGKTLKGGTKPSVEVNLIVGMTAADGISESNHNGFCSLASGDLKGAFRCAYLLESPPTHAKMYAWFRNNKPVAGYVGSANYTQQGFFSAQREAMSRENPDEILAYYRKMAGLSCLCTHPDAQGIVKKDERFAPSPESGEAGSEEKGASPVLLSLLTASGRIHDAGGLNWGQRTGRNPNQAYIPIHQGNCPEGFFPEWMEHFTVQTDDGQFFNCSRSQQGGKAIHSTKNNELGEYFRHRLGVPLGRKVTKEDLEKYGRTDVGFYKLDEDDYYMDFSVPR